MVPLKWGKRGDGVYGHKGCRGCAGVFGVIRVVKMARFSNVLFWVIYVWEFVFVNNVNIGESCRTLGDRVKEHLRVPFTNIATLQGIQSVQTASP